jgi:hypothetical protein
MLIARRSCQRYAAWLKISRDRMKAPYRLLFCLTAYLVVSPVATSASRKPIPPKCGFVSPIEMLKTSKAVFSGHVIEVKESEGIQVARFKVSKSWKNIRAGELIVTNYIHHEGPYFHQGKGYLVYAYEGEGKLATGRCSGTVEVEYARAQIKQLDKWKARNKSQGRAKSQGV